MKSITLPLIALSGALAIMTAPASAQLSTSANGPYYATPSWDQKLTTNRFVILANWDNAAVLDRETGLVWERAPAEFADSWEGALSRCWQRVIGGRNGWRLPAIQELLSLVDPTGYPPGPALPAGHPFLISAVHSYWSSTSFVLNAANAWAFDPLRGGIFFINANTLFPVWCVRGG